MATNNEYTRVFTEEEDNIIKNLYSKSTPDIIASIIGSCTGTEVALRANKLHLWKLYEEWEDDIIKENYAIKGKKFFEEVLPYRTYVSIKERACKIGVTKSNFYTEEQIQFLKDYYPDTSTKEIAEELGKSMSSVSNMACKLKLKKINPRDNMPEGHSYCARCKCVMPGEAFAKSKRNKSGFSDYCKACDKIRKEDKTKNVEKREKAKKELYVPGEYKKCLRCDRELPLTSYSVLSCKGKYSLRNVCTKCVTNRNKEIHVEKIKEGKDW